MLLHQLLFLITSAFILSTTQSYQNTTYQLPRTDFAFPLFAARDSHHIHVYIGSPPQRRIVIVDTGSRLLVFPCHPCNQCGTKHVSGGYFDPEISSTDSTNDCNQCVFKQKFDVSSCSDEIENTSKDYIMYYSIEMVAALFSINKLKPSHKKSTCFLYTFAAMHRSEMCIQASLYRRIEYEWV